MDGQHRRAHGHRERRSPERGGPRQQPAHGSSGAADATSEYIAVTLLVASRSKVAIKTVDSAEQLRDALGLLGAVPASDLLALEVIWQPDGEGDVLSADELITAYPQLKHL